MNLCQGGDTPAAWPEGIEAVSGHHHILVLTLLALMPQQRNLLSVRYNGACAVCVCVCMCVSFVQTCTDSCPSTALTPSMECTLCVWTVVNDTHYSRSRGLNRPRHPGGFPQWNEKGYGWSSLYE